MLVLSICQLLLFKLRLGALILRSFSLSVCPRKIKKKIQNSAKCYKTLQIIEIRSPPPPPPSLLFQL